METTKVSLDELRAIVFDWDGTIIRSNEAKVEAFYQIFRDFSESREIITDVLKTSRESSRFVILERIFKCFADRGIIGNNTCSDFVKKFSAAYEEIVQGISVECPEVPAASSTIQKLSKRLPLFLSSTTPKESLIRIITARGLSKYFTACYGYPDTKEEAISKVLSNLDAKPREVLVVGDGISDFLAAQRIGCQFVGLKNAFETLNGEKIPLVRDFYEFAELIGLPL